ncbi:putative membrane protein [Arthrobacter stackebrandtii]|uniref:Membrane protein n=1 Tax=Arthrobacter stackebrandtii TaxID=272161 RepID=A0ABS4YTT0_9MICC|nr:YhgE/Pip domain-containing protein [Arthrobacter stackebrandtii]MBP2412139.1 putative membrane protein [Arthrobacter stackebrandtii]PYH01939.1 ABC transporter [Arthrobacter stackebrandtii]
MTVFRLALSELKRMTGGILPKLTIVAMVMVPLLYGAVYLYANWDPYGNLDQLKAAVVVEDEGAVTKDGKELHVGRDVAENLVEGHKFDWQLADTPDEANNGVKNGNFAFALIIPKDFSANLASPENFDSATQAMMSVTTNDANNYLLTSIVDKVTTQVHASVAQQVGEQTANSLLTGYGTIHAQLVKAADGAQQLADGAATLDTGVGTLKTGTAELLTGANTLAAGQATLLSGAQSLQAGAGALNTGLDQLNTQTATLPADTQALSDGAAAVAQGNATLNGKVQSAIGTVDKLDSAASEAISGRLDQLVADKVLTADQSAKIRERLGESTTTPAVTDLKDQLAADAADIQKLADGSAAVAAGASKLAGATPALTSAIGQLAAGSAELSTGSGTLVEGQDSALAGANQLAAGALSLDTGAGELKEGSAKLSTGAAELADQLRRGAGDVPDPNDKDKDNAAGVIADPIRVDSVSQAQAANYGSGLAPFFLVLALWIGAFMLVQVMRPLTVRALASNAPSWKIALGGWLPFATVASGQALLLYAVVKFGLGLDPSHPWLTLGLLLLASLAFTALIQGIVALLGTPGKFVVLILLVLQLVSSGGTFPWQTTPEPLHIMHQILPMGHVVEGMRHLIYGADLAPLVSVLLGLLGYTLLGLLMAWAAVAKKKTWTLKTLMPEIEA